MATLSLEFMLDYRKRFVQLLSRHYPIPTPWLSLHPDIWDWEALSRNTSLAWDEALIDAHLDRWTWSRVLSRNPALPWSANFIRKHIGLYTLVWMDLPEQPKVFESAEMVALCLPHWSAYAESIDPTDDLGARGYKYFDDTPWGADAEQWAPSVVASSPGLLWHLFSAVEGFPWSADFIEAHADKLDWRRLSFNSGLPWSIDFIRRFEDRWEWRRMTRDLPWSIELLEAFEHRFNWNFLSVCEEVPWTEAWIDRFAAKVSWARPSYELGAWDGFVEGLLNHPGFRWTPATFARYRSHLEAQFRRLAEQGEFEKLAEQYWTYHCDMSNWTPEFVELLVELEATGEIDRPTIDWERLSRDASGIWTPEFVDAHYFSIQWLSLPDNHHFPWTERLDDFAEDLLEWSWQALSRNEGFAPSASTLLRYADRWDWRLLSRHTRASAEALVAVADRLDMALLASNPNLDRRAVFALRDHWPPQAWQTLSHREFVSFADAESELPWFWDTLIERAQAELCSQIDDVTFQYFVSSLVKDREAPARNLELESAIAHDLEQRDNYEVYADWLSERGDPHALLIRSMLEPGESFDVDEFAARRVYPRCEHQADVAAYERFIEFDRRGVVWRRGFVRALWDQRDDWRRLVGLRAFRFLEILSLAHNLNPPLDDAALELLRPLDRLAKLSVLSSGIHKPAALAQLPALTDLRLDHSSLTDLSPLAGLPRLRSLTASNTQVRDLGPLAEVHSLRRLHVGRGPILDLSPLRACRSLVELDVRNTSVSDLSPLRELTSLRRIFVENAAVDEAQIRALREALPSLEFCNDTDFWRGVGEVGPFFRASDC